MYVYNDICYIYIISVCVRMYIHVPLVPHKAVVAVPKVGRYRRGELLWCMDGRANPLMDRKVVGVVISTSY